MFKGRISSIYRFISVGGQLSLNLVRGQENKKAGLLNQRFSNIHLENRVLRKIPNIFSESALPL